MENLTEVEIKSLSLNIFSSRNTIYFELKVIYNRVESKILVITEKIY